MFELILATKKVFSKIKIFCLIINQKNTIISI